MPPRRRCHLAMPQKALLYDPELVRIVPVAPPRHVRGKESFNLGSDLLVGHEVGFITDAESPSDGLRRRNTFDRPIHCDQRQLELALSHSISVDLED